MTEYDYSPEAVQAYHAKLQGVRRWVDKTNESDLTNPFTSVPTIAGSVAGDVPRSRSKHRSKRTSSRHRSKSRTPVPAAKATNSKATNYPYATHYYHSQYALPSYLAHYVAEMPPHVPFAPPFVSAAQYIPNQSYTRPVIPAVYGQGHAAPPQRSASRKQCQYSPASPPPPPLRSPPKTPSPPASYALTPKRNALCRFLDKITGGARKTSSRPNSPASDAKKRHHRERRNSF
ncbi:uncharacterized protein BT62DRAFT_923190 [Guyanagaster necrorhizus]|uniref:Uncharacterized protein n=1 Tax=Guyanagaster necrorhizus TaxID=856835 RepID=A0A9P8AMU2_9AGAR|nr:uncharacterized protein BT62DRAFT_923190 [Guyanagaster necrorhizus MCA 3950]KAG7441588.1 hypothetical protein BT62DRAFT_923190 [Guyanagaster necrorhizus MCA 3950]